jgi:hypothetical protein
MKLRELYDVQIDEAGAGPSRINTHIRNGVMFIMLSAMRAHLSRAANMRRTELMRSILSKNRSVSFIETTGEYHEEGQPEPSEELSFFIMPTNDAVNPEIFKSFGITMMKKMDQDSIIFGNGEDIYLIENSG